jgi:hypothetical protein
MVLAVCIPVLGCRHHRDRAGFEEPDPAQRALALTAATHFQAEFNAGLYQLAYDEASPHFRLEDSMEWRRQCALLKDELGAWKSFASADTELWSNKEPIVAVVGVAQFERDQRQLATVWTLENGEAYLFHFAVRKSADAIWTQFPVILRFRGPMIDPPMKPTGRDSASL